MKPRQTETIPQKDLFQPQLVDIINLNHPLVRLAKIIDWKQLTQRLVPIFQALVRPRCQRALWLDCCICSTCIICLMRWC
jgi:hypothetical protein